MDCSLRKWLAARPACPAPMTTAVLCSINYSIRSSDLDRDAGRVGEGVEHGGALLRLGHQRLDVLLGRVRVDVERHLDVVEAVADVPVRPEDAPHLLLAFPRRLHRLQL